MDRCRLRLGLWLARLFYRLGLIGFDVYFDASVLFLGELGVLRVKYVELERIINKALEKRKEDRYRENMV